MEIETWLQRMENRAERMSIIATTADMLEAQQKEQKVSFRETKCLNYVNAGEEGEIRQIYASSIVTKKGGSLKISTGLKTSMKKFNF